MNTNPAEQSRARFLIFLLLTFLIWITAVRCGTGDDTYWHIKVGEWIWANKQVPSTGIFSYTAKDFLWVSHEWVSALLIFAIFKLAGWPGLIFLAIASLTLAIALLFNFLVKRISVNAAIIFVLFAYFLVIPHIMPRPHILMLPMMVFWTSQLIKASENHTQPPYPLALFMTLWSNMHGSFILGIAFGLFFAAECVWTAPVSADRIRLIKKWLLFLFLCAAAVSINPHGINGLLLPLKLTDQSYTIDIISEWLSPNFHGVQPLEFWLLALIGLSLYKGLTLPVLRLVFLLGLIHLALKYVRFATDLLPFISPLILAAPFSLQLDRPPNFDIGSLYPRTVKHWLAAGLYLAALAAYLPTREIESEQSMQIGKVLVALEKEKPVLGNVLNSYGVSVHLIHYNYPVFIDSRAELYGDPFIKKFFKTITLEKGAQPLLDLLKEYKIGWIIFETRWPVVAFIGERPEWRSIYSDRYHTIFLAADRKLSDETERELKKIKDSLPPLEDGVETELQEF